MLQTRAVITGILRLLIVIIVMCVCVCVMFFFRLKKHFFYVIDYFDYFDRTV